MLHIQSNILRCKWLLMGIVSSFAMDIFAQQSQEITFQHDGLTVYGTLLTPAGTGKFPTIIINPGTGAVDRDGTIALTDGNSACLFPVLFGDTLYIYKELAEALVDSGYAVLRYDKLEYTYTPAELGVIDFHKLWLPAESAIDYVKTRNDVDTSCIILMGHSEGSTMIPIIARNRTDVMALISIAGNRTPFDSLLAYQFVNLVELLRPCGATDADSIQAAGLAAQILFYFNLIRTNNWNQNTPSFGGVPASVWYEYISTTDSVAIHYNEAQLPTLFIGLGSDFQVPPSELERFREEVHITDDFWSIPGLTHYMTRTIVPHVSQTLTDTIIYWLRQEKLNSSIRDAKAGDDTLLKISPNPVITVLTFELEMAGSGRSHVTLLDSTGKPVWNEFFYDLDKNPGTVDLGFLPSGIYYFQIIADNLKWARQIVKL